MQSLCLILIFALSPLANSFLPTAFLQPSRCPTNLSPSTRTSRIPPVQAPPVHAHRPLLSSTDEYEEVELDELTNSDFDTTYDENGELQYFTEWKIGTLSKNKPMEIVTTWVRLFSDRTDGKFLGGGQLAEWGDGRKGKWSFDERSQFLSISKDTFVGIGGKDIWACEVNDFYYLRGAVRGWRPWAAADVKGQWQGIRLGVDQEERGEAPWFGEEEEEGDAGALEGQEEEALSPTS